MSHDLTTAWNIPIELCFSKPYAWFCKTDAIEVHLSIYPSKEADTVSALVRIEGLPPGVTASTVTVNVPFLAVRSSDFKRYMDTEEVWLLNSFISRRSVNMGNCIVVLQIALINPTKTEALVGHRARMKQMFLQQSYADWNIITADGQRIPVHKSVLAAQSPVFQSALSFSPSEDFHIDDTTDTVTAFLCFLYTGEVSAKEMSLMAYDLYVLADKYLVPSLKKLCEIEMIRNVNASNSLDLLYLASLPSGTSFKNRLLPQLVKRGSLAFKDERFETFVRNNNSIAVDLINAFAKLCPKYQALYRSETTSVRK